MKQAESTPYEKDNQTLNQGQEKKKKKHEEEKQTDEIA